MCGRFALDTDFEKIREQFGVETINPLKSFNIAPTEAALCIMKSNDELTAVEMRFGIVPWYAQNKKPSLLLNARVETVTEKAAFRQSLKYRRCLVLMSGFFEWQHSKEGKNTIKQPYYISRKDKKLMAVAGLWDKFKPQPDITIPSCLVLTTNANEIVKDLHDRMPWMLTKQQQEKWLEPQELSDSNLQQILSEEEASELECYPVTQAVNSAYYKELDSLTNINK